MCRLRLSLWLLFNLIVLAFVCTVRRVVWSIGDRQSLVYRVVKNSIGITEPEFAIQVAESVCVFGPVAQEVHTAVLPSLKDLRVRKINRRLQLDRHHSIIIATVLLHATRIHLNLLSGVEIPVMPFVLTSRYNRFKSVDKNTKRFDACVDGVIVYVCQARI